MKNKGNVSWRRSKLAAFLLLRYENGTITPARKKTLKYLVSLPDVTNRLIDQGINYHIAKK